MHWRLIRRLPWIDSRARFVADLPRGGVLLDVGSSDGQTLRHLAEVRPDLRLFSTDIAGQPENYPPGCEFRRCDIERERLPWPDAMADGVTCMQVLEHLHEPEVAVTELARLLKPGALLFIEVPDPKTRDLPTGEDVGFTFNFYDDPTHVRPLEKKELRDIVERAGLRVLNSGASRNLLFAAAFGLYRFLPRSHRALTARAHFVGWSYHLVAQRPFIG